MKQIRLTDEEIKQCEENARRVSTLDMTCPIDPYWLRQNLIKAQLKKVVEPIDIILEGWRDSNSIEVHNIMGQLRKLRQAILKEVE